jgi:hypothetical protein
MRRRKMRVSVACSQSRAAVRFQETKKPAAVAGHGLHDFRDDVSVPVICPTSQIW